MSNQRRIALMSLLCVLMLSPLARGLEIGPILDTCPQNDPVYTKIRSDFEIRRDGIVVGDIPCTEPVSAMPTTQYTDELIAVQALRAVIHMDSSAVELPMRDYNGQRLYDWFKARGAGIDIQNSATYSQCCEVLDNKPFFIWAGRPDTEAGLAQREFDRTWRGIEMKIGLFAHELRHRNEFFHSRCCAAQNESNPNNACDDAYDTSWTAAPGMLGSYGIQRWLDTAWLNGDIYTGFSCLPNWSEMASWHLQNANMSADRFCTEPADIGMPTVPGGVCRSGPTGGKGKVDVFILADISGSFADDWPNFQAEAPALISLLDEQYDAQFGLGVLQDYPIYPFGDASLGDKAYELILDFTDAGIVSDEIADIPTPGPGVGGDSPQSQLSALYQIATGDGEDLSAWGYPGASIPRDQNAHFRAGASKLILLWTDAEFHHPGDPGDIPYPGPTEEATLDALFALDPAKVIGISAGTDGLADLQYIAGESGALAPEDGVDCDDDGVIDIAAGDPLVCALSTSSDGIGEAVASLVEGAVEAAAPEAICGDVAVSLDPGTCAAAVSVDAGSFDPDGDFITLLQSPPGPYPVGQNAVTLTVTDTAWLTDSCVATIIVEDTTPPVFTSVPADVTAAQCGVVNIGTAEAVDPCMDSVTVTNDAPTTFPAGGTVVTWTATDETGNTTTATQTVTVALGNNPACCPAGSNIIVGTSNNDTLVGTAGRDCILGLGAQDNINGMGGDDIIDGGDGDDIIYGGNGDDVISGGTGQDIIDGGWHNDRLFGDDGDDRLIGSAGDDLLFGGQGQDRLTGGVGIDACIGGEGTDTFATCESSLQ